MTIFINQNYEIKAIYQTEDTTLAKIETDRFFDEMMKDKCEAYICSYKYKVIKNEEGKEIGKEISPYRDIFLIEAIQAQYESDQKKYNILLETIVENDYRLSLMELGL